MIRLINLLKEIGESGTQPYLTKDEIKFHESEYGYRGNFKTESDIKVDYEFADEYDGYIFSFGVKGSTQQGARTSTHEYLRIMSTVFLIIQKFIEKFDPDYVQLTGDDKLGSKGQKNRIYTAYLEKNKSLLNKIGYESELNNGELFLVKLKAGIVRITDTQEKKTATELLNDPVYGGKLK